MLDGLKIDVVVHLAAVTGGCREEDGLLVNVEGTRKLLRYFSDRGCTRFVNASSIAAVGFQSPKFRPLELPIPDEHPCLDRNGYGLSKYLMEEVTKYMWRALLCSCHQRAEDQGIAMSLTTPDRIRTLQRKLYAKAKKNRPIAFTRSTTRSAGETYSVMLGDLFVPTEVVQTCALPIYIIDTYICQSGAY